MDLKLKGKKAVVLGGTRGIGRSIVETLIGEGVDVAFCARNEAQVTASVDVLSGKDIKVIGAPVDISNEAALTAWVSSAGAELGGIDILVSNASALTMSSTAADWNALLSVDILGLMHAVDAAMPMLEQAAQKHGDAAIVSIGSIASVSAAAPSAYGAIKGALVHLVKGLAKQNAPKQIRANVVSPGTVYFEGGAWHDVKINMPEVFQSTIEQNPTGRMASPEEIANAAVFLASPLSGYTTGINMIVDGALSNRVNY